MKDKMQKKAFKNTKDAFTIIRRIDDLLNLIDGDAVHLLKIATGLLWIDAVVEDKDYVSENQWIAAAEFLNGIIGHLKLLRGCLDGAISVSEKNSGLLFNRTDIANLKLEIQEPT